MPTIPRIQRTQSIPSVSGGVRRDPRRAAAVAGGLTAAAEGIAQAGGQIAAFVQRQDEADANAWVSDTTAEAQRSWIKRFNDARVAAPPGAEGFTPGVMADFDKDVAESLKAAPNDIAREDMEARYQVLKTQLFRDSIDFEGVAKRQHRAGLFEKGIQNYEVTLFERPDLYGQIVQQVQGDLRAGAATWMTPAEEAAYSGVQGRLAEWAVRGLIAQDARTAFEMLQPDGPGDAVTAALPAERRAVLLRSAGAAVTDLDQADAQQRSAAETRAAAVRAVRVAQLDLAISRGEAGYKDVEDLASAGDLTPAEQTKFLKVVDKRFTEDQKLAVGRAKVAAVIGGGGVLLDPKSKEDREAFNSYYAQEVLPAIEGLPPDEQFTRIAIDVGKAGMVPDQLQGMVRGALRAGDAVTKAHAADFMARIAETNPQALNEFTDQERATAFKIVENMRAGLEPAAAVNLTDEIMARPKAERDDMQRRWRDEKQADSNTTFLEERSEDSVGFFEFDPEVAPDFVREFNQQQQKYFLLTADQNVAQRLAWSDMSQLWAVSEVGNTGRRWMKYAPESFGIPGMDRGSNAAWMGEQLVVDTKALLTGGTGDFRPKTTEGRVIVANKDGSHSTERTVTVVHPQINDGEPTNIPTMFGGEERSEGEAIGRIVAAGGRDPETGRVLPGFESIADAERAARKRSDDLGKEVSRAIKAVERGKTLEISTDDDLQDRITVAADRVTEREAKAGRIPSYLVLLRDPETGALNPLLQANDEPERWRPNWAASPEYQRRTDAEAEQRVQAREELTNFSDRMQQLGEFNELPSLLAPPN